MNRYTIVPSNLQIQSGPEIDQNINLSLENKSNLLLEYDRTSTVSLAQKYDDERQVSTIFRPTFKVNYIYDNSIVGHTIYPPFKNNLYYIDPVNSKQSGIWKGYPQFYEFDFYRPKVDDNHINYVSKSAYTYNWLYYLTYPFSNDYNKELYYTSSNFGSINWMASDGIPFNVLNTTNNGSSLIQFNSIVPHGLSVGEYVELSFYYGENNLFQVYSLGNGELDSDINIFNVYNYGYTGDTFLNGRTGTFKRVVNPNNLTETKSKYYIRVNKVIGGIDDIITTKNGFELNPFNDTVKLEYSSITPNDVSRISVKSSSNSYNFTLSNDVDISKYVDNQGRPITELFLTIINRGYSGYFNLPQDNSSISLRQGWEFNLNSNSSIYWDRNNVNSNSNINVDSYSKNVGGIDFTFYYNRKLNIGDLVDGDFCEWNDYYQEERVISEYYQKCLFNKDNFSIPSQNIELGYYYRPHNKMVIRVFSDYVETSPTNTVNNIPSYSYYSNFDNSFRWRDIYTYGFIDDLGRGVDYPFLNGAHYPYSNVTFKLIPETVSYFYQNINYVIKPIIDECE